jgi:protein-disulfide isomerase
VHGRSFAHTGLGLGFSLLLACRPEAQPIAAPASGGDFVAASEPQAPAPNRAWRDALRADRLAIAIPEHTPRRGASDPLVTIVQFGDYTNAVSATQARAIADALQRWPSDVGTAFVQLPARSRKVSRLAAQTAASAGDADRFWQVHDRLFATPPQSEADLERIATEAGLDLAAWKQAIAGEIHRQWIDQNTASARELGIVRAPALFVNGRPIDGDAEAILAMVASERDAIAELVADGLPRAETYAEILAVADVPKPIPSASKDGLDPQLNYAVPAADRPVLGPVDAPVTIVVFSDFQCPFCARAQETLTQLRARHPDDVRIVFRNMPLAFHKQARELAKVALAADAKGKFWAMHDLIFANRITRDGEWKSFAKKLKLDARKLAKAMQSPAIETKIQEDEAVARAFGVTGTPTFFVNGRLLGGAQPLEEFERIVLEELGKAKAVIAHDAGGEGSVYDRMIEGFIPGEG